MIVVTKEPGKDPKVNTITNDLEGIQKAVGGFFEVVRFWDNIVLVCNDNGKFEGLPYNFTFYDDDIVVLCFSAERRSDRTEESFAV